MIKIKHDDRLGSRNLTYLTIVLRFDPVLGYSFRGHVEKNLNNYRNKKLLKF